MGIVVIIVYNRVNFILTSMRICKNLHLNQKKKKTFDMSCAYYVTFLVCTKYL